MTSLHIPQHTPQQKFSIFIVQLATLLGYGCFGQHANASIDYFDLTLEQLMDTKILTVSKKNETLADAPAAIYVVTSEDIVRSGVTNIPDALRMVPGMVVASSDSNSWAISIRGFNSTLANKLLVLIDGRTIYNPVFGGVLWEAHELLLADIARIEVIRGPGGTLWGANAVNGVINIITKHSRETQGNLVSALYGNEEQGTLSMRKGGTLGDDSFYRVYSKAFKRDSSYHSIRDDNQDQWDGIRGGFRADWGDKFTFQGDAYRNETKQRTNDYFLIPPYSRVEDVTVVYDGVNLLGRWTDKYDDGAQLTFQSYLDWARRNEPFNFIDDRTIYDADLQYNFAPWSAHEFVTGAGFRYLRDNKTGNNNVAFSPKRRQDNLYNAFVQDKITLAPERWYLTLGAKFEHNDFSGSEVQPNIRLQWHPSENQILWGAISRAVRTPTPLESDLTRTLATVPNVRAAFVPNDNFKSEELTAYELGYRNQLSSAISIDLSAFYNDYDHLATYGIQAPVLVVNNVDPPHFLLPFMFANDMKGTSDGVEATLNWIVNQNLKTALNYSFLHMSLTAVDPAQEGGEKLYPTHQGGIKVFWNMGVGWTLDTLVSYVDNLPAGEVDAYTRLDINLSKQLTKTVRFNLAGQNLLEKTHREFATLDDLNAGEIERSLFAKITWAL
jgi:iron complex outermembrane recepter protein